MKYKVGDKVKIREDLIFGKEYGYNFYKNEMAKYKGKTTFITDIYATFYELDIDKGVWGWSDEMLEPIVVNIKNIKNTYKDRNMKYIIDGDKTIIIQYYTDKDGVKRYRKGVSKKHPLDVYNEGIGVLMSVADAYGIDKKLIHIGECKCHKDENNINKNKEEKELEFIKKFKEEKIAISVDSQKKYNKLINFFSKYHRELELDIDMDKLSRLKTWFDNSDSNTFCIDNYSSFLGYSTKLFYRSQGFTIIPFEEINIFKDDIDLSKIDTEDLLEELKSRVK